MPGEKEEESSNIFLPRKRCRERYKGQIFFENAKEWISLHYRFINII